MRIAIINGPNMNLLGLRQPELYGTMSFETYFEQLQKKYLDIKLVYYQSNHEGDIIDYLQKEGFAADGIVLNAAAYTHTSVAIRDAVLAITTPVVEVHLTDISHREKFRQFSFLTDVCKKTIIGKGLQGYAEAIDYLIALKK